MHHNFRWKNFSLLMQHRKKPSSAEGLLALCDKNVTFVFYQCRFYLRSHAKNFRGHRTCMERKQEASRLCRKSSWFSLHNSMIFAGYLSRENLTFISADYCTQNSLQEKVYRGHKQKCEKQDPQKRSLGKRLLCFGALYDAWVQISLVAELSL